MEGSLEEDLKEERNIFSYACRISYHTFLPPFEHSMGAGFAGLWARPSAAGYVWTWSCLVQHPYPCLQDVRSGSQVSLTPVCIA